MKNPKKIYKYRFTDYSAMTNQELFAAADKYSGKIEDFQKMDLDLDFMKNVFGTFLHLHAIIEEIKNRLEDEGLLEEMAHNLSIENIKIKLNID